MQTKNPIFSGVKEYGNWGYQNNTIEKFSVDRVLNKTLMSLTLVFIFSVLTFVLVPASIVNGVSIAAAFGTLIVSFIIARKRVITWADITLYSLIEGLFIGGMSKTFEILFPGIVGTAIIATVIAAVVTMLFHKFSGFRFSSKAKRFIMIGTVSLGLVYLFNLVMVLFGVNTGIIQVGPDAGLLSMVVSIIGISLAVFNLLMDFDNIEQMELADMPKQEELRAAFGLMVTLVWMYMEILRILSYFRD